MNKLLMLGIFASVVGYSAGTNVNATTRAKTVKTNLVVMDGQDGVEYIIHADVPPCGAEDSKTLGFRFFTRGNDEVIIECRKEK